MELHALHSRSGAMTPAPVMRPRPASAVPQRPVTLGIIVGSRGFFPDHLAQTGRTEMMAALQAAGIQAVVLDPTQTQHGAVQTRDDAKRCAELFIAKREAIDGIIVSLPNFGEEKAVADTLRLARVGGVDVPVLVQATPDTPSSMGIQDRRDSFCGKMSACNNLRQYGIRYSLTTNHTEHPSSEQFRKDLLQFAGVCRVVRGLRGVRIGAIGARPAAFNTVRYSEKLLEQAGISVETFDLSEILGRIQRLPDDHAAARAKLDAIHAYVPTQGIPAESLLKMAKLGAVIDDWMAEVDVTVSAIQCWTAMEDFFGVVPCTVMSMLSNDLLPSACEVDVCGTVSMLALSLASGTPSALLDWNNNYGDNPNKAVCFHCSNLPKHFFEDDVRMDYQEIIAGTVGKDNTFGTVVGRVKSGPMSFARFSTDDQTGRIRGYVGDGHFTNDPLTTFGGAGVVEIPELQSLLRYICREGFEHHVAGNLSHSAAILHEATTRYLGWDVLHHGA